MISPSRDRTAARPRGLLFGILATVLLLASPSPALAQSGSTRISIRLEAMTILTVASRPELESATRPGSFALTTIASNGDVRLRIVTVTSKRDQPTLRLVVVETL